MAEPIMLARDVKSHAGWSVFLGVLMIALGVFLVVYPFLGGAATVMTLGIFLLSAGIVELILALRFRSAGDFFLKLFSGIIYGITGFMLVTRPLLGVAVLTLLVGSMFLVQGIILTVLAFQAEKGTRGWLVLDAVVTLILSFLILGQWPASSVWAIGTLVGIAVIMRGMTRIATSLAIRRAATMVEERFRPAA